MNVLLLAMLGCLCSGVTPAPPMAMPTAETDPVPDNEDAADDPAIWVNARDPGQSVVIGTNKKGGLGVYDLSGSQLQYLDAGKVNNIDLREGFMLGGKAVVLVAGSHRTQNAVRLWTLDPATRMLSDAGSVATTLGEPYGLCLYHSARSGEFFAIATNAKGNIEQHRLRDEGGKVVGSLVRSWKLSSQAEGCAADDELGHLFVAEEDVGVWRFGAEPDAPTTGTRVDGVRPAGNIAKDAEGIAIWKGKGDAGYLIVSAQGNSEFCVYERSPPNEYLGAFGVGASPSVDAVTETDGVEVTSTSLGVLFPSGMLVVQDGENDGLNQNFKLVPWEHVARAVKPGLRRRP